MYEHMCVHLCAGLPVEVREQLDFPILGFLGSNPGHQTCVVNTLPLSRPNASCLGTFLPSGALSPLLSPSHFISVVDEVFSGFCGQHFTGDKTADLVRSADKERIKNSKPA